MGELIDKFVGRAKQVIGALTGNRKQQSEGVVDETKGKIKGRFEDIKHEHKRR